MNNNKIAFYTLGCRLNQAETDKYQDELEKHGFFVVIFKQIFNIAVVNTCAVTHKADREGRQAIRQLKKKCPHAKIIMTGCSDFKMPEIDFYIKNKENFVGEFIKIFGASDKTSYATSLQNRYSRTRSNIKIQTGCDNHCTYCLTTIRRGKSRSFSPIAIINEIKQKEKQGYKEVVLTGVNIGQYKYKNEDTNTYLRLPELIQQILNQTKIKRIRLSSINPDFVYKNNKFKNLFLNPRLCRHLHLSLQSGSEKILKSMNRNYTAKQYLLIIKDYYKVYPDFGFTTDVIVGFPSETDQDFQDSLDLVKACKFLKIHIFRYSIREGTPAAIMKDQVDEKIKKQRAQQLQKVNQNLQDEFKKKMKGQKLKVLFEVKKGDYWCGHAGNFFSVKYKSKQNLENKISSIIVRCFNL
ncbi:MAG: tRNA (N(6)-L-threonylcarbamoyladenosine(37)-C(2))-methylthiotransferase MtaB [Patescibacteria group bacterium]